LENIEEENVADAVTCAKCGKPILDKESTFCAYCGVSFDSKPRSSGLTGASGILAIIAAVFSVVIGVMGINYYQQYVAYYAQLGMDTSGSLGFLLFASFAFVAAAIGFAGGMLAMGKKRLMFSVTCMLVLLASGIFTFVCLWHFGYGFIETLLLPGISILALSIVGAVFALKSKANFSVEALA
jgi:ribosomal protein L37E